MAKPDLIGLANSKMYTDTANPLIETNVVCPHCWQRFYVDQALYISRHPELREDSVLGPDVQRRFLPKEVTRDRSGAVLDSNGWNMTDRACPTCHLQVPQDLLEKKPFFVSVVGAPRSGKTYFLTAMLHGLRKELAKYFAYSMHDSDSHDVRAFLEYEQTLFYSANPSQPTFLKKTEEDGGLYNLVRLDGAANVRLPKPFIFSLRPTEANIDIRRRGDALRRSIVLYDNAGESFDFMKDRDGRNRVTQHLTECDAVMFAVDPLQDPDARSRLLSFSGDPQLIAEAVTHQQATILSEVIHRIRRYRDVPQEKRLDILLAVCVLKYDVWSPLMPRAQSENCGVIDQSSIEYFPNHGIAALDVEEINNISLLVRSFLEDLNPELVALAEANFKTVRYFPVSALGRSPEPSGDYLMIRPIDVQPFRATHPMLWLFRQWSLIRRTKPRADGHARYPKAKIESRTDERIRVLSPITGQPISLDRQYEGSSIIDPSSGEMIWIPRLDGVVAPPSPLPPPKPPTPPPVAKPASAPPPPPALKLNLGETPIPPKRGWFGKKQ